MGRNVRNVGVGLVGLGFMGLTHLRAARKLKRGKLVAAVTSDPRKARGDFSAVRGNFGAGGAREDMSGIRVYPLLDDLLEDSDVDLVDICLPSFLHAEAAIRCMKAGKAVLVEKPIALALADVRRMLRSSESTGRLLMVAQVLKFFPQFAGLAHAVRDGSLGKLRALHLRRIIAQPGWGEESWFTKPELSGGMVVDLHIHDTDFVVHVFGRPRGVASHGIADSAGVHAIRTCYDLGEGAPLVTAEAGWINAPSLPFEHGYDAYFEAATVQFNSTSCPAPRVYGKAKARDLRLPSGDGFELELQAAVESVRNNEVHELLSPTSAATSLEVCMAEARSAVSGRSVRL